MLGGSLIILLDRGLVDLDSLSLDNSTNPLLEKGKVVGGKGVGLGDNRDQVDAGRESLHDLDVEGLKGVTGGSDEVQASVDTEIDLVGTAGLLLLKHVGLVLVVDELDNGHPRVPVVDVVTESGGVNNGQTNCAKVNPTPIVDS